MDLFDWYIFAKILSMGKAERKALVHSLKEFAMSLLVAFIILGILFLLLLAVDQIYLYFYPIVPLSYPEGSFGWAMEQLATRTNSLPTK